MIIIIIASNYKDLWVYAVCLQGLCLIMVYRPLFECNSCTLYSFDFSFA